MKTQDIINAILNIDHEDELRKIAKVIKIRHGELAVRAITDLRVGDRVVFDLPSRYKMPRAMGCIIKINKKTVRVNTDENGVWDVAANMIHQIIVGKKWA
jgi:hypothetical protein